MIDGIIRWSLTNRPLVLVGAALLLLWGGYETLRMPVDVFPDLTAPTVTVIGEAPGMAPEEVERLIAFPIETSLNGAPGVRRIRSSTSVGIAVIWAEFEWGTDIYKARQVVTEKLQLAESALPPELEGLILAPVSSIMGEIMFVALTSDRHTPMDLKTTADWEIRRRLLAVRGVSQVVVTGGDTKQYQVLVRPERLSAYGVSLRDVERALGQTNENTSAGFFHSGGQEYLIRGIGRVRTPEDIAATLVATRGGEPVLVRHIADVTVAPALKRGEGSYNGSPAVILGIQKQPDTNTLDLTNNLDAVLDELQDSLPEGMTLERHIFRQADFIRVAIDNLVEALRDGALLVVLIVFLFLASFRPTAITILAIPLSLVTAVLVLKALGASINTMTLGGMAIAVGALVDDAIIDVENVVRRLRQNAKFSEETRKPSLEVVFDASKEIRTSIVFATFIIVLVFLPLFFLSGVEGRLLLPLGLAYIISLGASLVVALSVTPALCSLILPAALERQEDKGEGRVVKWLKGAYRPVLQATLHHWKPITIVSTLALLGSGLALAMAGQSFLPNFNEGTLTISAVTLPGTSLDESNRLGRMVETLLLEQPEVVATSRRTGRAELDEHAQGVNAAEIDVSLRATERSKEEFLSALRRRLSLVPGMNIVIGQPISHRIDHMLSGTRANIAVKVFGPDLYELRRIAAQVEKAMQGVDGVVDLAIEQQTDVPLLTIKLDREKIARYGLLVHDVTQAIKSAFGGQVVSQVLEGQAVFDLLVRYEPGTLEDLSTVRHTLVATPSGAQVPLHALAEVKKSRGPNTLSRENVERKIVVMSNVADRDLRSVVEDIQERIKESVSLPRGYHIEYGGQFESAEAASRTLLLLGILVVVGIFVLLYAALGSSTDAALVMVNLPLALIGGVAGVYLSGGIISVASIIGFITLFGIATRNGIMLVSHIQHLLREEGVADLEQAVERGSMERLSPILMTALGTGLALVPLAIAGGEPGSEIQTPMAIVILCGLLSSTVLNMVVLPALYLRFAAGTTALPSKVGDAL